MASFLCKFNGRLCPDGLAVPTAASQWEGGTINVPRPHRTTDADATEIPEMRVGDTLYLWVHEREPGSHGRGLTAKARAAEISADGPSDLNVRITQVRLIRPPVSYEQIRDAGSGRSEVGDRLSYALRQTMHILPLHVDEWERHYRHFALAVHERNAASALQQHRQEQRQELLDRFRKALARPSQGAFRTAVLQDHDFRCAITGESTQQVLEAAHVLPYAAHPAHRTNPLNGIALRADLHRLFDAGLLSVSDGRVVLCKTLDRSHYQPLHGSRLTTKAHPDYLREHHEAALLAQTEGRRATSRR
ncbi:HNH endonuclease [Roseococcus microcysteis]|uniref:HNH endonuclease n=1 Tax=Roseococcus microcysteis TaxID=2771361 RepID=UPI00168C072E|nr:HNH endonuclease signature motif containing protein [Roseococcus microcysteis]